MSSYHKFAYLTPGYFFIFMLIFFVSGCRNQPDTYKANKVLMAGAMKDVMWKGQLDGRIFLDTLKNKEHLYGIGPEAFLKGELLIMSGNSYAGRVETDSTMTITNSFAVKAPFFVYSYVPEWKKEVLPSGIRSLRELEDWLTNKTGSIDAPFAFKITGKVKRAQIHLQNLPEGSTVSSPAEAHRGQRNYILQDEAVNILGFFSKQHKGIFTHHDTFIHLHLITKDLRFMGHLDNVEFQDNTVNIFLPKGLK